MSCTIIGFLFFHIAAFGCKTFQTINAQRERFDLTSTNTRLGYWSVYNDDFGGCLRYSNDRLSSIWKFGRFIGIFGSLLSWLILISVLLASCFKYPKLCFTVLSICMGIMSLFSFLLLAGLASKSDRFTNSTGEGFSVTAGSYLAVFAALIWAGGSAAMISCMNERSIVPVPTRPVSRHAGPSYVPSIAAANDPTRPVSRNDGPSYPPSIAASDDPTSPSNLVTTDLEVEEEEIVFSSLDDIVDEIPVERPVVDTQVERTTDPNGNETVITTTTTFLPDGSRVVTKTIETVEEAE